MARNLYKGIACMILSALSFALMGVFVHLAGSLFFIQKAFFRNLIAFIIAIGLVLKDKGKLNIPKESIKFLFLRSATGCLGIFGNFYALDRINISDALMLNKMSPFFAVLFSAIFLKERIKPLPFLCILGAVAGSIFVIKPSIYIVNTPAIVAFIGGAGAGAAYSCVRKLGSMKVTGSVIVAFFSLFSCLLCVPFLFFHYDPMTKRQVLMLLLAGVSAAGGQFGITYAYYYASAGEVSIYDYSNILFSAVLGYLVFSQVPDLYSVIGYLLIIGMAVIVFLYNRRGIKVNDTR